MKVFDKFFQCHCGTEGIALTYEYSNEKGEEVIPLIDIAFWRIGYYTQSTLTFKEKIRWIWQIIIKGKLWGDMVTLNPQEAKGLADYLLKFSKKHGVE